MTKFRNVHRCVNCRQVLSRRQKFYSYGRCPLCGHKGEKALTIVDTTEEAQQYKPSLLERIFGI